MREGDHDAGYDRIRVTLAEGALATAGPELVNEVRRKLWMQVSEAVASDVGLSVDQLHRFVAKTFLPTRRQLAKLLVRLEML
jgi:hypothetical protein